MKKMLILGATSAIAIATARHFATHGAALYLVARDSHKLQAIADDLRIRGASQIHTQVLDLNQWAQHASLIESAKTALTGIDIALIAHGVLPDQAASAADFKEAYASLQTNLISPLSLLTAIANCFAQQHTGTLAVITSVAGDRGRQSNYVYGSAKAALNTFLEGLRHRFHAQKGIQILTIKPGLVATPMTAHLPQTALFATPDQVATDIVRAIEQKKTTLYTPRVWRPLMWVIRQIPDFIFLKSRL